MGNLIYFRFVVDHRFRFEDVTHVDLLQSLIQWSVENFLILFVLIELLNFLFFLR